MACIRSERNVAPARLKWAKNGSCERAWAKNVSRRPLTPRAGAIFLSRRSCFRALWVTIFALLGLMVDASATKFAQRTKNSPKPAVCGVLGEHFRGNAGGGGVLGELFRGPTAAGSRWANFWCLDGGCVPPLGLGHAHAPRSRVDVALDVGLVRSSRSRAHFPLEARVGASLRPHATAFPQDSSRFAENATHPYI